MPILKKNEQEKNFTQIPNEILRRKDMSLGAKGLLCYMLSCTEDWKFSIKGLSSVLGTTEHMIGKFLSELEEKGYHKKEAIKEKGKIVEWKYYVSDYPAFTFTEDIKPVEVEKPKKKNLFEQCTDVINETISDEEVKSVVTDYLIIRIKEKRLSVKSWETIVKELYDLADSKEKAIKVVKQSIDRNWMKFYPLKEYKPRNRFVDDIQPVHVENSFEDNLRVKYMMTFCDVPKCDRPNFEEWKENQ